MRECRGGREGDANTATAAAGAPPHRSPPAALQLFVPPPARCTAALAELSYTDIEGYTGEVEFISAEAWDVELGGKFSHQSSLICVELGGESPHLDSP